MASAMEKWWLLGADQKPVGPVTTELLTEGITAGKVPPDALVCVVGGSAWEAVGEIALFASVVASVVAEARGRGGSDPPAARKPRSRKLLELEERTIVDGIPLWPAEAVSDAEPATLTVRQQKVRFDDPEEHTVVDASPLPSDPPE